MIEQARAVAQRLKDAWTCMDDAADTIDALVAEVERNLADHANIVQAYEDEIERLRRTLHNISLAAHDSGSTREGMGKEARAALEPLKPCTSDEWLSNCPQSVRDLANKIKQEKK